MSRVIKKVSIIVGIILVIVIALHIALFAFINAKGRGLIVGSLKDKLDLEATLGSLSLKFPFNIEIKDFGSEVLSFKKANVSLGFFNPFTRNVSLSKVYIDGLDLKVTKDSSKIFLSLPSGDRPKTKDKAILAQDSLGSNNLSPEIKSEKKEEKPKSKEKKFSLAIGNLYLESSRIEVNYPIDKRPLNIIFSDIFLKVKGFTYPKLTNFYVKLDTVLVSPPRISQKINALGIEGWVDYHNQNMDVDININDFDYIAFGNFLPPFWRPNNLRLKEAALSFRSNLKSKDNNLIVDNFLTIEGIEFIEEEDGVGESFQAKTLKTVIAFLKGEKEKPTLHFKLTTNMDSPKLDFSSLKKSLLEASGIGPLIIIEGAVNKIKEKVGGMGNATIGNVIETLKAAAGTVEEILKIESEKTPQE